jgi:hypothetical protein
VRFRRGDLTAQNICSFVDLFIHSRHVVNNCRGGGGAGGLLLEKNCASLFLNRKCRCRYDKNEPDQMAGSTLLPIVLDFWHILVHGQKTKSVIDLSSFFLTEPELFVDILIMKSLTK